MSRDRITELLDAIDDEMVRLERAVRASHNTVWLKLAELERLAGQADPPTPPKPNK